MAPNAQKRQRSPSESRPTKKAKGKTDTSVRRSDRSGKSIGGAVEQLRKAGDAVASQSKRGFDAFEDAGEGLNPMAPESPTRKSKKVISADVAILLHVLTHAIFRASSLPLLIMPKAAHAMYFPLAIVGGFFANHSSLTGRIPFGKARSPEKGRQVWVQTGV